MIMCLCLFIKKDYSFPLRAVGCGRAPEPLRQRDEGVRHVQEDHKPRAGVVDAHAIGARGRSSDRQQRR